MNQLVKFTSIFIFTFLIDTVNAFALISNGNDGDLLLNNGLTLNSANNKVFNYTTVNLGSNSILDFSGLNNGDSVFIIGNGDMTLGGIINLPSLTSFTFETMGDIHLDGSIFSANSNLSFISNSFFSSSNSLISDIGGSSSISAGRIVINGKINVMSTSPLEVNKGGDINIQNPFTVTTLTPITPVPEPSSYSLFILGLLGLSSRLRRLNS